MHAKCVYAEEASGRHTRRGQVRRGQLSFEAWSSQAWSTQFRVWGLGFCMHRRACIRMHTRARIRVCMQIGLEFRV
jgi:hypothetical protein